jgi:hypothetical protein
MDNPAQDFKRRKQPKNLVSIPSQKEFQALVKALRQAPKAVASGLRIRLSFLAHSGLRVGEAREVRFRDLNYHLNTLLASISIMQRNPIQQSCMKWSIPQGTSHAAIVKESTN